MSDVPSSPLGLMCISRMLLAHLVSWCVCLLTHPLRLSVWPDTLSFSRESYREKVEDSRHTCITPSSLSPSGVLTRLRRGQNHRRLWLLPWARPNSAHVKVLQWQSDVAYNIFRTLKRICFNIINRWFNMFKCMIGVPKWMAGQQCDILTCDVLFNAIIFKWLRVEYCAEDFFLVVTAEHKSTG